MVTDIRIRNSKVPPLTLKQTLSMTHVDADLRLKSKLIEPVVADVFELSRGDLQMSIAKVSSTTAVVDQGRQRWLQVVQGSPGSAMNASLYGFYDIEIKATCTSSASCTKISGTMQRIQDNSSLIADPARQVL